MDKRGNYYTVTSIIKCFVYLHRSLKQARDSQRPNFRVCTVKILLDGHQFSLFLWLIVGKRVMESRTAALHEPYLENCANPLGILNFEPSELNEIVTMLDKEGFQVPKYLMKNAKSYRCIFTPLETVL